MILNLITLLLLSNALSSNKSKALLYSRSVVLSLFSISLTLIISLHISPLSQGIALYGGLFNVTLLSSSISIFIYIISGLILTLNSFLPRKVNLASIYWLLKEVITKKRIVYNKNLIGNKSSKQYNITEYGLIIVFVITGAMFLVNTSDLISIFLSIELQSYGLYILSSIYRDSELSTGSGLTYFLLGGLSSCFILLGSALLYANSGTTSLENISIINTICDVQKSDNIISIYQTSYIQLCMIILVTGFLFKVSAAPFHFWSPDVYDGVPTIVTTFIAIIAKISIFIFLLSLVYYTESDYGDFSWKTVLLISSFLSLIVGSILGLTQTRIKRLFAYSAISHVGFILLALAVTSTESIQAYLFYILQYSLANLNSFIILITMGYTLYTYSYKDNEEDEKLIDQNNSPIQLITQIKGFFYINSYLSISLAVCLFSLVGIPPLMGFFAKQMVLSAALDKGYVFITLIGVITSVIGASYYLKLIKQIFFYPSDYINNDLILAEHSQRMSESETGSQAYIIDHSIESKIKQLNYKSKDVSVNSSLSIIISILTLLLSVFIFIPTEWFNIVSILAM